MVSKTKKFIDTKLIYKNLINSEKNIFLIAHLNNMNIKEFNSIFNYCNSNNIKKIIIKLNVIKKLTTNELFLKLFKGPTIIFQFPDILTFLNFVKNSFIINKIIPLSIYLEKNFYSYHFFYNFINKNKSNFNNLIKNFILNQFYYRNTQFLTNLNILKIFFILKFIVNKNYLKNK